ncbi:MAG: hypothetical protein HeimC2_11620 [Candidatus Heimdallarchaeota archaeon LC_2]|nr:MAG: hypothetical protein HeimC2_11620 [Candidatus Heimdallarchaeota archaeon LC_2]
MTFLSDHLQDVLIFISGIIALFISIIFLQLYLRYKRRDYFLLALGFFAGAISLSIGELDAIIQESITTEAIELISAIFTFFMVILILIVLIYPDKVPFDFEEKIIESNED